MSDADHWEAEAQALTNRVSELEDMLADVSNERDSAIDRYEDAESDVVRWQDRAYEAEGRADEIEAELSEANENYHDLEVELDRTAYERDCYKEVLRGMEFVEIDTYPEKGPQFCTRLGVEAKETIETVINQALEKR